MSPNAFDSKPESVAGSESSAYITRATRETGLMD